MARGKGYKLTSPADAENGGPKLCAFYASDKGCRNGANCKFSHVVGGGEVSTPRPTSSSPPSVASSSVVSSESDGGVSDGEIDEGRAGAYASLMVGTNAAAAPVVAVPNPFLSAVVVPASSPAAASEKKKKKRKKSSNEQRTTTTASVLVPGENVFDLGSAPVVAPAPASTASPPPAKKPKRQPQQQKAATPTTPPVVGFRDLRLPIAPFALPGTTAASTTTSIKEAAPIPAAAATPARRTPPLPTATPSHLRWRDAVIATRKHANYASHYDFDRSGHGDDDGNGGRWMFTRPYDPVRCASNPSAIAIDCEMCESRDPVSGRVDTKALCRLSVVDADAPDGPVLLDTLVRPRWPVSDHRTWINGISASSLEGVEFTLEHAQAFMDALCSDQTVIVGHAVHNDLLALRMDHGCIVDTALLYAHADVDEGGGEGGGGGGGGGTTPSLRNLALGVLGREMPDARLRERRTRVAGKDGNVGPVDRVYRRSDSRGGRGEAAGLSSSQQQQQQHTNVLLVHRLPVNTLPEHISEMFLAYASIRPKTVPDIAFAGPHGKCHVEFSSSQHAELAYATLVGEERADKTGKMQKRVGLKGGGYVCVRKMKKEKK
ncbi:hypothetical protein ACHAXA_009220 [Cyclostephanos tholiformis]|uniref:C3H1-type domain-containing protein n=1 Tax=Cyclostephanos tholiformis TaxID=382380 RepID=A0ABD3RJB2_9STRA